MEMMVLSFHITVIPDQTGLCHLSQLPSSVPLLPRDDSPYRGSHCRPYLRIKGNKYIFNSPFNSFNSCKQEVKNGTMIFDEKMKL